MPPMPLFGGGGRAGENVFATSIAKLPGPGSQYEPDALEAVCLIGALAVRDYDVPSVHVDHSSTDCVD